MGHQANKQSENVGVAKEGIVVDALKLRVEYSTEKHNELRMKPCRAGKLIIMIITNIPESRESEPWFSKHLHEVLGTKTKNKRTSYDRWMRSRWRR